MKLTKRQRKALRGPNAMVNYSLKNGEQFIVGNAVYLGKNPTYGMVGKDIVKTGRGIPFVRAG